MKLLQMSVKKSKVFKKYALGAAHYKPWPNSKSVHQPVSLKKFPNQ